MSELGVSDREPVCLSSRLLDDATLRKLQYFRRLQCIISFVRERCSEHVGLAAAASVVGMTPSAFSRYFADKVGITFSYFCKVVRIERALAELESCDRSVTELAELCGYAPATFSRTFKELIGMAPSEYRRRFLETFAVKS